MTETASQSASAVKRRQYLLLAGIAGLIAGAALLSVSLTDSRDPNERPVKPRTTNILAPGGQVDPKDAWRGQADAQLKSIEQRSRELSQRNSELEGQNKAMLDRLRKLESGGLIALPPPPVTAPAARPQFGPDRPGAEPAESAPLRLPPPPAPPVTTRTGAVPPFTSPAGPVVGPVPQSAGAGILTVSIADASNAKAGKVTGEPSKGASTPPRDSRRYIPSGAFTRAILLGGLDAPTGGQSQRNPQPVLLRLVDNAVLPNHFRSKIKECFVVGAGYGDVSSERAYIRTESLSCVTRDGTAIDVPVKGYVAGEDGKAGMRGRLVSKQGQLLANALLAGVASGIGHAFQQSGSTTMVSPLGTTSTVDPGKQFEAGLGTGVGRALDRLAQYYISLAEKVFPVIEVDAGRTVDVVITQGISLQGSLDAASQDREEFPQLTERTQQLRRNTDDDQ